MAGRGIDHQQHLVRCLRDLLGDHAANLGKLLHEVGLRLQPARCVDDADISANFDRAGHGSVGHAGRIAAALPPHDLGAEPLGPHAQLLHGCCAKCVTGAQNHPFALLSEPVSQLGDRRRFA